MTFKKIVILYNPNSTGNGEQNARELADDLQAKLASADIAVRETEHAGHGEEIAAEYARSGEELLLVSSSGDGGYHEVVNGALSEDSGKVITAVLPSGNANDHYSAMASGDLVANIVAGRTKMLDVIRVEGTIKGKSWSRVAHSYVGFGLTPTVGRELTRTKLNIVNEKWHVLKHMVKFRYVTLRVKGRRKRYASVVFATIDRIAKIMKLEGRPETKPGQMNVYTTPYQPLWKLFYVLLKAAVSGLNEIATTPQYKLTTLKRTPIQLDGEVFLLDGGSEVVITCETERLETVV